MIRPLFELGCELAVRYPDMTLEVSLAFLKFSILLVRNPDGHTRTSEKLQQTVA